MTAKEAKQLTEKSVLESSTGELASIYEKIKSAAQKGSSSTPVSTMHQVTKNKLESDGFTVKYYEGDFRESGYYSINW